MNNLLLLTFLFFLTAHSEINNDIEGEELYSKVISKYNNISCYSADLEITEYYNEDENITKGTYKAKGDSYIMSVPDQEIHCNGDVVWLHSKDMSELSIIDYTSEDAGLLNLVKQYMNNKEISYLGKSEDDMDVLLHEKIMYSDERTTKTQLIYLKVSDDYLIHTFVIENVTELKDSEGVYNEESIGHIFTLSDYKFSTCTDEEFELSEKEIKSLSKQGVSVVDLR